MANPDVVIEMQEEYTVPADGTVPSVFLNADEFHRKTKSVKAIEIRPAIARSCIT
ncbi:MAG: hypothetical protein U0Y68_08655 [Blastocatellia bacterium]